MQIVFWTDERRGKLRLKFDAATLKPRESADIMQVTCSVNQSIRPTASRSSSVFEITTASRRVFVFFFFPPATCPQTVSSFCPPSQGGMQPRTNFYQIRWPNVLFQEFYISRASSTDSTYKKLGYRRGTARCGVSVKILPIATQ